MDRDQYVMWCKERAMAYVERGQYANAVASMLSDLGKNKETESSSVGALAKMGMFILMQSPTKESVTKYIQGFN